MEGNETATSRTQDEQNIDKHREHEETTETSLVSSPSRQYISLTDFFETPKRSNEKGPTRRSNAEPTLTSRERKRHGQDLQRYEKNYENWQQVKSDARSGQNEHLSEIITLQHELIRVQDELSNQKREQQLRKRAQERESFAATRHAREEALLQICRQSLEEDRAKSKSPQKPKNPPMKKREEHRHSDRRKLSQHSLSSHSSLASMPIPYTNPPLTPSTEIEEEYDNDEGFLARKRGEDIPWHHKQLYKLYGEQADNFLHPKFEQHARKPVDPKLRKQGGRVGADALWTTLRNESQHRLLREDENISRELKSAFSSFVRQCLSRHKRPVKRNYYSEEDVPEMERLLDRRYLNHIRSIRHKTELMYRASQSNEDKTRILTFHNPIPDLNNASGEESIMRYLPSWQDDKSVMSEPEYMRWLKTNKVPETILENDISVSPPSEASGSRGRSANANSSLMLTSNSKSTAKRRDMPSNVTNASHELTSKRREKSSQKPKYLFLTEQDTAYRGQFSQKFKDQRKSKGIPKASNTLMSPRDEEESIDSVLSSRSLPEITSSESSTRCRMEWEPLSMSALMEYKERRDVIGRGDFKQGSTKMWSLQATAS